MGRGRTQSPTSSISPDSSVSSRLSSRSHVSGKGKKGKRSRSHRKEQGWLATLTGMSASIVDTIRTKMFGTAHGSGQGTHTPPEMEDAERRGKEIDASMANLAFNYLPGKHHGEISATLQDQFFARCKFESRQRDGGALYEEKLKMGLRLFQAKLATLRKCQSDVATEKKQASRRSANTKPTVQNQVSGSNQSFPSVGQDNSTITALPQKAAPVQDTVPSSDSPLTSTTAHDSRTNGAWDQPMQGPHDFVDPASVLDMQSSAPDGLGSDFNPNNE